MTRAARGNQYQGDVDRHVRLQRGPHVTQRREVVGNATCLARCVEERPLDEVRSQRHSQRVADLHEPIVERASPSLLLEDESHDRRPQRAPRKRLEGGPQ